MNQNETETIQNPLESESIGKLILKYSIPAIISSLVGSIYNIVDLCAQFFPSIGKGGIGTVVSLSRQVIFLLPLVIIFPMIWGIDGVLWSGSIADGAAGIMGLLLV